MCCFINRLQYAPQVVIVNLSLSHGEVKTTHPPPPIIIGLTKVNRHTSQ